MKSSALYPLIGLTGMSFGAEIVASHITQSLSLLVSAYHMLYNLLSLLLLVVSHRMSKGKTLKNTFGWARVKVLGQLVNMLFLIALCFAAFVEAIQTMVHASHEDTEPRYPAMMILLGCVNVILNILCFVLIGGYTHHQGCSMIVQGNDVQMNCVIINSSQNSTVPNGETMSSKTSKNSRPDTDIQEGRCSGHRVLDASRDLSSCLTVVACGAVIILLDGLILKYADAILAMAAVVLLLGTTYPFVRESGLILLQSIPGHIDVEGLTQRLTKEFPEVHNVHDVHVWRLTSSETIATLHILLKSMREYAHVEARLASFFEAEGISAVTVQPELAGESYPEKLKSQCILQCSENNNCGALTCCGPLIEKTKSPARYRGNTNTNAKNEVAKTEFEIPLNNTDIALPQFDFNRIFTAPETTV